MNASLFSFNTTAFQSMRGFFQVKLLEVNGDEWKERVFLARKGLI